MSKRPQRRKPKAGNRLSLRKRSTSKSSKSPRRNQPSLGLPVKPLSLNPNTHVHKTMGRSKSTNIVSSAASASIQPMVSSHTTPTFHHSSFLKAPSKIGQISESYSPNPPSQ